MQVRWEECPLPDSMKTLRLDKRLIHRRGWIDPEQLERELAALPDVAAKVRPPEEEGAGAGSGVAPGGATGGA